MSRSGVRIRPPAPKVDKTTYTLKYMEKVLKMRYPLEKYRFFTRTKKDGAKQVIAISTYGGKAVRGVANCDPRDTYNFEDGKKLAAARCNLKIAEKRAARAKRKVKEATEAYEIQKRFLDRMNEYKYDAEHEVDVARIELNKLIESL